MTDRKLLTHRPFRIWHCLCARDRYGGVHSSSAGSRVSELTDTPNLASSYCPRCEPERDPVREILTVCWCDEHRPTCEGADDARAIVGGGVLASTGEVNAATNRPWCELVHRAVRSEEHTSELQSPCNLVCRLLLEKKKDALVSPCSLLSPSSSARP